MRESKVFVFVAPWLLFLALSLTHLAPSYALDQDFLTENGIEPPQTGQQVCQAYLTDFRFWGRPDLQKGVKLISNLPERYCRYRKKVGPLRVVAVGDSYTFSDQQKSVYRPPLSTDVVFCRARAIDSDSGETVYINHLQLSHCEAGMELLLREKEGDRTVVIETTYDFHHTTRNNVDVARTQFIENLEVERVIRASFDTSVEI